MYCDDQLLPISALSQLVYCERRCALIHLEGQWGENRATTEGSLFHERVHDGQGETQGEVRITRGLALRSLRLGLTGRADVVEFRSFPQSTGDGLPAVPYPIEYKSGRLRHERCYEVQLCAQALCLEEMLSVTVPAGALLYGRSRRRTNVAMDHALRQETEEAAAHLHELMNAGITPPAQYNRNKCRACSMHHLCLPAVTGGRSARTYLAQALSQEEPPEP